MACQHQGKYHCTHLVVAVEPCPGPGTHGKGRAEERHYKCGWRGLRCMRSARRCQQRACHHADGWPSKCNSLHRPRSSAYKCATFLPGCICCQMQKS